MIIIRNSSILEKHTMYLAALCSFWKNLHSYEISGLNYINMDSSSANKTSRGLSLIQYRQAIDNFFQTAAK